MRRNQSVTGAATAILLALLIAVTAAPVAAQYSHVAPAQPDPAKPGDSKVYEFKSASEAKAFVAHNPNSSIVEEHFVRIDSASLSSLPSADLLVDSRPETPVLMRAFTDDPSASSQWALGPSNAWGIGLDSAISSFAGQKTYQPRIAILDTGWTVHPDGVAPVDQYDFITDPTRATDGDGRDADATDTGDWCVADTSNSSWHGTAVAGVITAVSNNGVGIRGMDTNGVLIHARVLGSCGGTDTDIADAIRWAAGGSVSGVSSITKVDVINLSLGGVGTCNSYMQSAIDFAVSQGTVVVVAAGNSNLNAGSYSPANCNGTLTIGASNNEGKLTSYSNYGSVVALLAPGGESPNKITVLGNTGTTSAGEPTYSNYSGTSFSAPHVAGAVAWLRSIKPRLTPNEIRVALRASATPNPSGTRCSTSVLCGSGILNLEAALRFTSSLDNFPAPPSQTSVVVNTSTTLNGGSWSQRQRCGVCYGTYYAGSTLQMYSDYICYSSYYYYGWHYIWTDCYQAFNWKVNAPSGRNVTLTTTITGHRICFYTEGNYAGVSVDNDGDGYAFEWRSTPTKILTSSCASDGAWTLNSGDVTSAISGGKLAYQVRTVEQNYGVYNDGVDDEAAISITSIRFDFTSTEYTPTWSIPPVFSTAQPISGQQISSTPGDWGVGTSLTYQWQRCTNASSTGSCSDISSATSSTYQPGSADIGKFLRLKFGASNVAGTATWTSGPTLSVGAAPSFSAAPTTPNFPIVGTIFTGIVPASSGYPAPTVSPQWYSCDAPDGRTSAAALADSGCVAIEGANTVSYTPTWADAGKYLRIAAVASNTFGSVLLVSSTAAGQVSGAPSLTAAPAIIGTPTASTELSSASGTWNGFPVPTTAYAWFSCTASGAAATTLPTGCTAISGATSSTYTPLAAVAGKYLRVRVTATNSVGASTSFSATTTQVTLTPTLSVAPAITGTVKVGNALTTSTGTWAGFPTPTYTYAWYRCTSAGAATNSEPAGCTAIDGALAATYAATADDYGTYLRAKVTGTNDLSAVGAYTAATAVVAGAAPLVSTAATVTGTATAQSTLTAVDGTWAGAPAVTSTAYAWFSCTASGAAATTLPTGCTAISGATSSTYTPLAAVAGKYLRVRVTATNSVGASTSFSATTTQVTLTPTLSVAPAITGTVKVGNALTTSTGTWAGFPTPTYTYAWYRCTSAGAATNSEPAGCTVISGASSKTYKAVTADRNKYLRVRVTATSVMGTAVTWSKATVKVL